MSANTINQTKMDNNDKRKLKRINERIESLRAKEKMYLNHGDYIKAFELRGQIKQAIKMTEEIEQACGKKPLCELLNRDELVKLTPMLLEAHLICDLLCECCYDITDYCKELQLGEFFLLDSLLDIRKRTSEFAGHLTQMTPRVSKLVTDNETLNAALRKKIMKYIEQRIPIAHLDKV